MKIKLSLGGSFHCFYCEYLWQASEELLVGEKVWGDPTIQQISCWDKLEERNMHPKPALKQHKN